MHDTDLKYKIAIGLIPGIGSVLAKKLIAYCRSAEGVLREKKVNLLKIPGIGPMLAESISNFDGIETAEKELQFIERYQIRALAYTDADYPVRLKNCEDSPVVLFVKGKVNLNHSKVLSIVGTRSATTYGKEHCYRIIEELTLRKHNPIIISGLAYGIDIAAHKAALQYNLPTVAILAHGLDSIYPSTHKTVAKEMLAQGGIATEFLSNTKMDRNYFLQRNRIIAGLADAVLVVESGTKGGALVTALASMSYNRDVLAIPGRTDDKYSSGCNLLIKRNQAALIENVDDIEYCLNWKPEVHGKLIKQTELFLNLNEQEQLVVNVLKEESEAFIDMISIKTGLAVNLVSALLLNLEFMGIVRCAPGKRFSLNR